MSFTNEEWFKNGKNGIHTKSGDCIATTHDEGNNLDKEANAQLIAAAPRMYNAIKSALNISELWEINETGDEHKGEAQALSLMKRKLQQAIEKVDTE